MTLMTHTKPEVYTRYSEKEPQSKKVEPMAKPHGIERKGDKYKVFLDFEGKRIHIAYCKTLEDAKETLEQAKKDAGIE